MKDLYRSFMRRVAPPRLLARVRQLSHIDDRFRETEAARAALASIWLRKEHASLFAGDPGDPPEFSIYSQNGEDGVLLWLLEQTGAESKTFVEIGIEDGRECNTAVLGFLLGWDGLMIEADPVGADSARRLAARLLARKRNRVAIRQSFVTVENINELIAAGGFRGEIGVLSIDVDGVDYWLWEAVTVVQPRVVVIEYNATFGPDMAVTVPYAPEFSARRAHASGYYHGASLAALERLGRRLGYDLAHVESAGVNAFFVRRDISPPALAGRTAAWLFKPHFERAKSATAEQQWTAIQHLPLTDVDEPTD